MLKDDDMESGGGSRCFHMFTVRELVDYKPVRETNQRRVVGLSLAFYGLAGLIFVAFTIFYNPEGKMTALGGSNPERVGFISQELVEGGDCVPLQTLTMTANGLDATLLDPIVPVVDQRDLLTGSIVLETEEVTAEAVSCENVVQAALEEELLALGENPERQNSCLPGSGTCVSLFQSGKVVVDGVDFLMHLAGSSAAEVAASNLAQGTTATQGDSLLATFVPQWAGAMTLPNGPLGVCEVGLLDTNVTISGLDYNFAGLKEIVVTVNWPASAANGHAVFDFEFNPNVFFTEAPNGFNSPFAEGFDAGVDGAGTLGEELGFSEFFKGNCSESIGNVALSKAIIDNVAALKQGGASDDALLPTFPEERFLQLTPSMTPPVDQMLDLHRETLRTYFFELPRWISGAVADEVCNSYLQRVAPFQCSRDSHKTTAEALSLAFGNTSIVMLAVVFFLRCFRE